MSDIKNSSLATDLVSYWELEEASGTRVDSHGSNDLTDATTTASGTGIIGDGADFTSDYLTLSLGSTGLELDTTFSVAFWMKADSVAGYDGIYMSGTQSNLWRIGISSGTPKLTFTEENVADSKGATTLTTGTWYHCVIVKDGDAGTNLTIYLNGSSDGTASVGTLTTPTGTARIGSYINNGLFFDGIIDEFGIWSRALSAADVTSLYNSGAGLPYEVAAPTATNNAMFFGGGI